MSLEFNADKQYLKGTKPYVLGTSEFTIRAGTGASEKEVMRWQLDATQQLTRVGINRNGQQVEKITLTNTGGGYSSTPTVTISAPNLATGRQATASALINLGTVAAIIVDDPGNGYTSTPTVTISGGAGNGATATATLNSIEYELDVNGAIRTSTSIISDTARVINLDFVNLTTADGTFRAPYLKLYANNTGTSWLASTVVSKNTFRYFGDNIYRVNQDGTTGTNAPIHTSGEVANGTTILEHVGYRVNSPSLPHYGITGDGIFPRSITPLQGDRSNKIATTEYVLSLATNDVGGRIYVSEQIGDDANDGRSAVNPVRTIKRACQIATGTVGVRETVIISGGDYVEDNPISIPPDCSIVGDSLRIVNVRPLNGGKHMFKFADKNYITGITFRDRLDSAGNPIQTWDYACAFDDKQRIYYDSNSGGDYGRDFPIGYQIFGRQEYRITFSENTGNAQIAVGETIWGETNNANATVTNVFYNATTGASAYDTGYIDVVLNQNSNQLSTGDRFRYGGPAPSLGTFTQPWLANTSFPANVYLWTTGTSGNPGRVYLTTAAVTTGAATPSHTSGTVSNLLYIRDRLQFTSSTITSIRPEGEIVSKGEDLISQLPITRIDASVATYNTYGGVVIYTNPLVGASNVHNFKENEEIEIFGLPTSSPDLSWLNGKQRVYKIIEDADARSRRIVIAKEGNRVGFTQSNYAPLSAYVRSYSYYFTLSLLNSPYKFPITDYVSRRYQDACNLIRNNLEFIKDETYQIIEDEFSPNFTISSIVPTTGTGLDLGKVIVRITTSVPHGFYVSDNVTIKKTTFASGLLNGNYIVTNRVSSTVLEVQYTGTVATLGLTSGTTYNNAAIGTSSFIQRGFVIPSETKCRRDIGHFVNAIIMDLEYGGNYHVVEAAKRYRNNGVLGYVGNELAYTVRSLEVARRLCIYAMRNWRLEDGKYSQPTYTPKFSSLSRYFDLTVTEDTSGATTNGFTCSDVASAITTLAYLYTDVLCNKTVTNSPTVGTMEDAGYLIMANADFIASEASEFAYAQFPVVAASLTDDQKRKCKRDIRYILSGLTRDLIGGGNSGIVTAAESYFTGNTLSGIPSNELAATRSAFSRARDLSIQAIRNWSNGTVTTRTATTATYNSTSGVLTVTFPTPTTPVTTAHKLAFKERALTFSCASDGGGNLASPQPTDRNYGKSLSISNVTTGGGNQTVTVNVGAAGTAAGVAHTFVSALANGVIIIYDPVTPTYETNITRVEDWNIALYGSNPLCANVASAITTEFTTLDNILGGTVLPGATTKTYGTLYDPTVTYPTGVMIDNDGYYITPRGRWDDLPIIEASPYIQNASVISFKGGGGCEVDGSKVKQPNCPFPGLEADGSATYPNQGKSMVAAQFTIVSFGGTGYKIVKDGYTQLVSVFVLFCKDGVLAESGGYVSITNAATNFGIYALRAVGYRENAYSFDTGIITNVSETVTGRTILTVGSLGRKPLEHYVLKIDGYTNQGESIEYFIEKVTSASVGPIFTATFEVNAAMLLTRTSDGALFNSPLSGAEFTGKTIKLHRPSIVNSSGHTWEFAGAGTNYKALPENGGKKIEAYEQVSENYGRVYTSGTDELGDFKVGYFAKIENRTGNITFTGTVSISEVEFLKLKGGDVVVTGFTSDNTLGGAASSNSLLPTQKAVKDYITTNLGTYINKPYSTNAVPRALVELTDSGKISIDQIPALRPFSVYTVADQAERLKLEGALAGDIAIEQDTSTSYILNNDLTSLFLGFAVNQALQFTINNLFVGTPGGGQIQAKEYRQGVVYQINITNGGSGYSSAPSVTFSAPQQGGGVTATAVATVANGQVTTITITETGGLKGGRGYTSAPTITIASPGGAGTTATATCLIESRLYGNITNNIKIVDIDTIQSSNGTPITVDINRVVNTSAFTASNWVSLSSNQVAADQITSGVIATTRLASNSGAANSTTFLRGDQTYAPVIQSIKGVETRYFVKTSNQTNSGGQQLFFTEAQAATILKGHSITAAPVNAGIAPGTTVTSVTLNAGLYTVNINNPTTANIPVGTVIEFGRAASPLVIDTPVALTNYIASVIIVNSGTGYTNGTYTNVTLQGGDGTGCKADIVVSGNEIISVTVTDGGTGYISDFLVTGFSTSLGAGNSLVLSAKINTVLKYYGNTTFDVSKVSDSATDSYSTVGAARFLRYQNTTDLQAGFNINADGNGSISLKTGALSGLNADKLDGEHGIFYLTGSNFVDGSITPSKLLGGQEYSINISGIARSANRLNSTDEGSNDPLPINSSEGVVAQLRNNSANGLNDGGTRNLVLNLRNGIDATYGGARQLALTDNNNLWIRGSGTALTQWSTWYKVWTSGNDASAGQGSGPDAFRLNNKVQEYYNTAYNINYGTLSDNRIPYYQTAKAFDDNLTIRWQKTQVVYEFYIPGVLLTGGSGTYQIGNTLKLFQSNGVENGQVVVLAVTNNSATATDTSLRWSIIRGRLTSGSINVGGNPSIKIGLDISNSSVFTDYTGNTENTIEVAKLQSTSGTALLKLGRTDGVASNPAIHFNSSATTATNYHVAMIASGGTATDGSGSLNIIAGTNNAVTINNNAIWNAGNISFNTGFTGANYNTGANSTGVIRDASGNAAFNGITLGASGTGVLTGSASLNVLKAGDTMTGQLKIAFNSGLGISETGGTGARLTITSSASGSILNVVDNSALIFQTDSGVEQGRFRNNAAGGGLLLTTNQAGGVPLTLNRQWDGGRLQFIYNSDATTRGEIGMTYAGANGNMYLWMGSNLNSTGSGHTNATQGNSAYSSWVTYHHSNSDYYQVGRIASGTYTSALHINGSRQVGINTTTNTTYNLQVNGSFAATTKSFRISHPTKENHDLVYGSLEGPEHGVYVRGKSSDVIELPDYWVALVDENTITVQLTPIGNHMSWVEKIEDNKILIGGGEAFYFVQAMRKDIEKLEVEVELPVEEEQE
jgi:hypothetical protein